MSLVTTHNDSLPDRLFRSASQSLQTLLVAMICKKPMVVAFQASNNVASKGSIISIVLDRVCLEVEISKNRFLTGISYTLL